MALDESRAKSTTKEQIESYFEELKNVLDKYDLSRKPHCIFNIGEKGFNTEHKPSDVVGDKKSTTQSGTSGRSQTVTVIAGGNAIGTHIPPFFVFPGKRMLSELLSGGMSGTASGVSDSGYLTSLTPSNLLFSFKRTSIHPFNPQAFDKSVLISFEVLQQLTTDPEPIILTFNNSVPSMSDDNPDNTVVHTLAEADHVEIEHANQEDENDNPLQDLNTFFKKRVSKVQTKKKSKPRKTLSKIKSWKAVTEDGTYNKITECVQQRQLKENL
ncbi:unnamed protein product [Mytilus coruscus]|uniref:Uncharacterized protein n=1 Tax=Mytilus coruscus TaxID=42192 RepID=A0A6J8EVK9_MYTCO|nr:unnamed protein product [Mytilus coruscus]